MEFVVEAESAEALARGEFKKQCVIVRCKDCEWLAHSRSIINTYPFCSRSGLRLVDEDGFCDCAERREDG